MCSGTYTINNNTIKITFTSAVDPDGNKANVKDYGVNESVELTIIDDNNLKDNSDGINYLKKQKNELALILLEFTLVCYKNETVEKYTLPEDNKTIFSSEYKLHMPKEQELISAVEEEKKNFELNEEN